MSQRDPLTDEVTMRLRTAVLRHGLPGVQPDCAGIDIGAVSPATLQHVAQWAMGQRLAGVWCDLLGELVGGTGVQGRAGLLDAAHALHATQVRTALVCEATAARAVEAMAAAGVRAWLIKGLPVAHLDYPDPAWRSTGDVDVLVQREALHAAVVALEAHRFRRSEPAPRPEWEARYGRAVMLRSEHGVEVDLHVAISPGYFGAALDHAQLCAGQHTIDLGGVQCGVLDDAGRLLGSSYAAVLSRGPNARYLRDLAQQLLATGADWQRAAALARLGDGEPVLAAAVLEATEAALVPPDHPMVQWAGRVVPSARARRALHYAQQGRSAGWLADARSQVMALGPIDSVRFVCGAAVPPRRVRVARGLTVGRQLRRGLRFARLRR
jgi:hypothetical protein